MSSVPRTLLDPKLDVVFKLLFADERNRGLLISLLTAILEPPEPITGVTVLNPFSDDLALHVLELPKLPRAAPDPADAPVLRWAKFFTADTEELEQLAMTDPDIHQAKAALERLSSDPAAQELARERELAAWNYEHTLHVARQEAEAKALRNAVSHLCGAFGIELTEARRAQLEQADAAALQKLLDAIAVNRAWP